LFRVAPGKGDKPPGGASGFVTATDVGWAVGCLPLGVPGEEVAGAESEADLGAGSKADPGGAVG
jgi:hypothetical protein